jgi:hypothetical protein
MPDNTPAASAPAAAANPAAPAAEAKPAPAAPAKPAVAPAAATPETAKPEGTKTDLPSFDEQVAADLAFKKARKAADAEIEARRKVVEAEAEKFKPLEPVLEHYTKGDVIEAIWALTKGKLKPEQVLALADRVGEQTAAAEIPFDERLKAGVKAELEAAQAAQAEKDRLADEAKVEEGKKSWEADFGAYIAAAVTGTADHPGFLKANEKEFPLCVAWRDKLPIADIEAEVKRRLASGESVQARDVFQVFEARFQADIDRTPFGRKPEPSTTSGERTFEDDEREFLDARKPRPAIKITPPDEAPYTVSSRGFEPPPGVDFDQAVKEHFARIDRERKNKARF